MARVSMGNGSFRQMTKVGILGLGKMGSAFALNLLSKRNEVHVSSECLLRARCSIWDWACLRLLASCSFLLQQSSPGRGVGLTLKAYVSVIFEESDARHGGARRGRMGRGQGRVWPKYVSSQRASSAWPARTSSALLVLFPS